MKGDWKKSEISRGRDEVDTIRAEDQSDQTHSNIWSGLTHESEWPLKLLFA